MRFAISALFLCVLGASACERKSAVAYGSASTLILVAPDRLWSAVEDTVMTTLEPTIQTVRAERTFTVSHVAPTDSAWLRLRQFRQVILLGYEGDGWLEPAASKRSEVPDTLPAIFSVESVWAQDQLVTVVLLPRGAGAEAVGRVVPELHRVLDERYKNYVRERMYLSGADEALQRRLEQAHGFSLLLPDVYRYEEGDSVQIFRNHYAVGSKELRRTILVTSRPGTTPPDSAALLAWRDSLGEAAYGFDQRTADERQLSGRLPDGGTWLQGAWETPPGDYPAGGPFIARAVPCPAQNRTYLMDAWLYAPAEDKYEYMLQLENILDSFHCADVR